MTGSIPVCRTMNRLCEVNCLVFWTDKEIRLRRMFESFFSSKLQKALLETNPAWKFHRIEAPQLTPRKLINPNYTNDDVWVQSDDLVLRPETTPGSYRFAEYLLSSGKPEKPPFVVWQSGKSFRKEQDQVSKNMRLKEFYQQEFQCLYTADTKNDYHSAIIEPVRQMISAMVGLPSRTVPSDRLPSYSLKTIDVEVDNGDKWMEVCSISLRTDFSTKARFETKKGIVEKDMLVLEVAIGLDRCVYNFNVRTS